MINKTEICVFFNLSGKTPHPERRFSAPLIAAIVGFLAVLALPAAADAQRLCENNDNPAATIAPCFGAPGTLINVKRGRVSPASGKLIFKRVLTNGVPAQVIAEISAGGTSEAPPQLCAVGGGRWEVWLVLADGRSQGKIGAFTASDCSNVKPPIQSKPNSKPNSKPGDTKPKSGDNNPPAGKTVVLPPITMNVDNEVYAKTQNASQSYIKRIASSDPSVATGTEWGTNDVKIRGKRPGVTIITFLDANTGTTYQVTVTVKERRKTPKDNDDGRIRNPPDDPSFDPCLVGEWLAVKVNGTVEGGTGIRLTIKPDGSQIVDYTAMRILNLKGLTYRYGGGADGVLSAAAGIARNMRIVREGVTLATGANGEENAPKPASGMGPGALGINRNGNRYSCSAQFLIFSVEDFQGKPFLEITMERQSGIKKPGSSNQPKTTTKTPTYSGLNSSSKIDRRLIGTWRSEPAPDAGFGQTAEFYKAGGVLFIVKPDGTAVFDYSGTRTGASLYGAAGSTSAAKGQTTAKIETQSNPPMITLPTGQYTSEITITVRDENGDSRTNRADEFFPFGAQGAGYQCDADSLTMNFGNVTIRFVRIAD